ncbi:hypothetical protein IA69_09305 [Massilia sp. JS1662]|nr:hypothetical protein [Massilia sp. JS1662]KGF82110.1 hypothetical protein IA69_09305 [Massilia sp. JS1662]
MLQQHLLGAAVSTCLTSPALHDRLRDALIKDENLSDTKSQKSFRGDCLDILRAALDREEPRRFREPDIEEVLKVLWPDTMFMKNDTRLPFFDALSRLLFDASYPVVHFRNEALDDYTRLSARIDPALLLCWKIGRDIDDNLLSTRQEIEDAINSVQPFCAPAPGPSEEYADNHVHLSGASSEQLILMAALRGSRATQDGDDTVADHLATIEALGRALLLSDDKLNGAADKDIVNLSRRALTPWGCIEPLARIDWNILHKVTYVATGTWHRWIKHMLAQSMVAGDLARAWLWLLLWCARVYQNKDCGPKRRIAIFLFLGTIMRIRQDLMVSGYGLNCFLTAYTKRAELNGIADVLQKDAARRIFHGRLDRAEVKVWPAMLEETSLRTWLATVLDLHGPAPGTAPDDAASACARWHFCLNFSRTESQPWTKAEEIEKLLTSTNVWKGNTLVPGDIGARPTLAPARFITTLDVAGDENASKSEIFAPALRWLRRLRRPDGERPLRLSIHAGEDYAHPLSGMRHIDETVLFCEMGEGDRIGHGLALGIKPADWFREHGQALLSVDDHVDNLVWAWHFATAYPTLPHAAQVAALYTSVVRNLFRHVTWLNTPVPCANPPTMSELHQAWLMRRNCRLLALTPRRTDLKMLVAVPDQSLLLDREGAPPHVRLFRQRVNWFNPEKRQKRLASSAPPCMVQLTSSDRNTLQLPHRHPDLSLFTSVVTPFEVTFIEALQDLLIERYRKAGLIFEANPTSNHYIGALYTLKDHPVFRWDPPDPALLAPGAAMNRFALRHGPLSVCVNTDDPGIMPTTIRTEYELLRRAALDCRFAPGVVNAWLNRLRARGNAIFESSHPRFTAPGSLFHTS